MSNRQKILAFCRGAAVAAYLLCIWWIASHAPWVITEQPNKGQMREYPIWSHPIEPAELQISFLMIRFGLLSVVFGVVIWMLQIMGKNDSLNDSVDYQKHKTPGNS